MKSVLTFRRALLEARSNCCFATRELAYQRWIFAIQRRAGTVCRFKTMVRIRTAKQRLQLAARELELKIYGPQGRIPKCHDHA